MLGRTTASEARKLLFGGHLQLWSSGKAAAQEQEEQEQKFATS
jgi:hypothetical protein